MGVRRVAGLAATAALVLALGACSEPAPSGGTDGGTDGGTGRAPATEKSPRPKADASPVVPVADPSHAVDAPGRRDGRLWSADILVQWDKPLNAALVKQIEAYWAANFKF